MNKKMLVICCANHKEWTEKSLSRLYPQIEEKEALSIDNEELYQLPCDGEFDVILIVCLDLFHIIELIRRRYRKTAVIKIGDRIPD